MAAPSMQFEFFIEIPQGPLRTVPGLIRTCNFFPKTREILGSPWNP